ncbi:hypothetical protein GCM10017557_19210 [Streptomyces aurantiacus]|uniref:Uncharacterized protein n=1 Tax=Streptomyces aurantiacus TaxID=47760 RepID=A0A7G1NWL4_9ACTN|nr:hypothetical protein GCM10017557_19210 [Streptomyces aurantiacus]
MGSGEFKAELGTVRTESVESPDGECGGKPQKPQKKLRYFGRPHPENPADTWPLSAAAAR